MCLLEEDCGDVHPVCMSEGEVAMQRETAAEMTNRDMTTEK